MLKIIVMIFVLVAPNIVRAATCAAGYYLGADGKTCVICKENVESNTFYCPGDDIQHKCPTDTLGADAVRSVGGNVKSVYAYAYGRSIDDFDDVTDCWGEVYMYDDAAEYLWVGQYTGAGYAHQWRAYYKCNAGYYMSNFWFQSGVGNLYKELHQCTNVVPAHGFYSGPGVPDSGVCPLGCDAGYGLHNNTCMTLCAAGFTQLKTSSGVTVNVYADKPSTPALNISTSRGTCYVTLASGAANSAINVNYNGATYHTTD